RCLFAQPNSVFLTRILMKTKRAHLRPFNVRQLTSFLFCLTGLLLATAAFPGASLRAGSRFAGSAVPFNTHTTRNSETGVLGPAIPDNPDELATYIATTAPTRSTFMARWKGVSGAIGYRLNVSTDSAFANYVEGFHDLDVGNTTGRAVTGLVPGTRYFYRVQPYGETGAGAASEAGQAITQPATGLNIQPTFDTSITGDPNAAAIEACINRAIGILENLFGDAVVVPIRFRYSTVDADGHT